MKLLKTHWRPEYDFTMKKRGQGIRKTFQLHAGTLMGFEAVKLGKILSGDKLMNITKHRKYYKWVV